MKLFLKSLLFLLAYTPAAYAGANNFEEHQHIKDKAFIYLTSELAHSEAEYSIEISDIDQRLKLKKCSTDFKIKLTQDHVKPGKNTLSVRCHSSTPWRIFMTAKVKIFTSILVAKKSLNKGHILQKNDLKLQRTQLTSVRSGYLINVDQAINKVLKRRLNNGDVIRVNNLSKPILIKKGDAITIMARSNGFNISMKGIALTAGSKGDKIKVKNTRTKRIIQGTIFDTQTVKVNI
ncbi:MAG: flagellar basal body P-ring formation protein FlgA [Cycloclasticus sp.]|nr:flagellar basal body P-ring formation protein FlgA [Cycloclasticus sp.]